jgi:hypothetical protein
MYTKVHEGHYESFDAIDNNFDESRSELNNPLKHFDIKLNTLFNFIYINKLIGGV